MNRCENCHFSRTYKSSRTVQEWQERIDTLQAEIDKIEAEEKKEAKSFWSWLPDPPYMYDIGNNPVIRRRSRIFDAMAEIKMIENNVVCRRFPDSKIVEKNYECGEYKNRGRWE